MNRSLFLSFRGRIGRASYWSGIVAVWIAGFAVLMLAGSLRGDLGGGVFLVGALLLCYPALAITTKRWHDRNKSGWWSLIGLVPLIGAIWALVDTGILPGTDGPNRFGPDPIGPTPVQHDGKTYYRAKNGSFTDAAGNTIADATLVAGLGAAFLAQRQARIAGMADAWNMTDPTDFQVDAASNDAPDFDIAGD